MNVDKKWPFLTIVSFGVGMGVAFVAGRTLTRVALRWRFSKQTNMIHTRLKERINNPIPVTRVITRLSEWEEMYSILSRY